MDVTGFFQCSGCYPTDHMPPLKQIIVKLQTDPLKIGEKASSIQAIFSRDILQVETTCLFQLKSNKPHYKG